MKYSLGADIMYVGVGKTGHIWPETEGILEAMELAKENGLDMIEFFGWEGRDLEKIWQRSIELNIPVLSVVAKNGSLAGVKEKEEAFHQINRYYDIKKKRAIIICVIICILIFFIIILIAVLSS